jgi:DNA-binding Lrp family transcriptional regulator
MLPVGNSKYILKVNKKKILNLIYNSQLISRAEATKKSGISAPTVSRIVDSLIKDGLVQEIGMGKSTGGRCPRMLKMADTENYIIGIDLGTTNIYGILADLNARIIYEEKRPTKLEEGFYKIMDQKAEIMEILIDKAEQKNKRLCGVGLAVAGLINKQRNIVEFSPNFHWHDLDIIGYLGKRFDLPIFFDNVTRVMALGELCYGIGKKYKDFIFVNIGYGIGAGIILNGHPLLGAVGMAGEFGHITVEKDSKIQCDCGNFGVGSLSLGPRHCQSCPARIRKGDTEHFIGYVWWRYTENHSRDGCQCCQERRYLGVEYIQTSGRIYRHRNIGPYQFV